MKENNFERISSYYNTLVGKFGYDPRSCDYGQSASQQTKFSVLSNCMDYSHKSVLDIGCGFADYADFLNSRFEGVDYHGVDISPAMIEEAKKRHPSLSLELKNVFEQVPERRYDIVTANGIFYLLGSNASELMKEFITKMYVMSEKVVAFNSLSQWADNKEESEFYADPLEIFAFCKTLSPWVTLRNDYHSRDFTIYIYRERNQ